MQLKIEHQPCYHRPWLIKRVHGTYEQHAHCFTKKDAKKIRNLIDINKYPYSEEYKRAMKRPLTEEEFKGLNKKQRFYNVNNGVR